MVELHTSCVTSRRVHRRHKLPLLCQAEKPPAIKLTPPTHTHLVPLELSASECVSSSASAPSALSACA